ncbi:unnamed protein product [Amoebophrya sp. A25]|nr:unnamed protein product [Amoebophrya sp. A25]|eukprot:GSA25T00010428001.1
MAVAAPIVASDTGSPMQNTYQSSGGGFNMVPIGSVGGLQPVDRASHGVGGSNMVVGPPLTTFGASTYNGQSPMMGQHQQVQPLGQQPGDVDRMGDEVRAWSTLHVMLGFCCGCCCCSCLCLGPCYCYLGCKEQGVEPTSSALQMGDTQFGVGRPGASYAQQREKFKAVHGAMRTIFCWYFCHIPLIFFWMVMTFISATYPESTEFPLQIENSENRYRNITVARQVPAGQNSADYIFTGYEPVLLAENGKVAAQFGVSAKQNPLMVTFSQIEDKDDRTWEWARIYRKEPFDDKLWCLWHSPVRYQHCQFEEEKDDERWKWSKEKKTFVKWKNEKEGLGFAEGAIPPAQEMAPLVTRDYDAASVFPAAGDVIFLDQNGGTIFFGVLLVLNGAFSIGACIWLCMQNSRLSAYIKQQDFRVMSNNQMAMAGGLGGGMGRPSYQTGRGGMPQTQIGAPGGMIQMQGPPGSIAQMGPPSPYAGGPQQQPYMMQHQGIQLTPVLHPTVVR